MQAMSGGPTTPIEQVSELGETILEKLIAAGITTVEALADMTPEQLEEVPGIGEKTVEKISVAVRHYFGQYEEGEERPPVAVSAASETVAAEPQEAPWKRHLRRFLPKKQASVQQKRSAISPPKTSKTAKRP